MPDWQKTFKEVFDAGVAAYNAGTREPDKMFNTRQQVFLGTIGATAREIFDFVEDYCRYGEPDFDSIVGVAAIRKRYFQEVQHGIPSQFEIDPNELPPKAEELDGIRWLPRIIAKANAKLRGELDASTMYGCGGDRPFVERAGMTLPEFLQLVWDSGNDNQKILDEVKRPGKRRTTISISS